MAVKEGKNWSTIGYIGLGCNTSGKEMAHIRRGEEGRSRYDNNVKIWGVLLVG